MTYIYQYSGYTYNSSTLMPLRINRPKISHPSFDRHFQVNNITPQGRSRQYRHVIQDMFDFIDLMSLRIQRTTRRLSIAANLWRPMISFCFSLLYYRYVGPFWGIAGFSTASGYYPSHGGTYTLGMRAHVLMWFNPESSVIEKEFFPTPTHFATRTLSSSAFPMSHIRLASTSDV